MAQEQIAEENLDLIKLRISHQNVKMEKEKVKFIDCLLEEIGKKKGIVYKNLVKGIKKGFIKISIDDLIVARASCEIKLMI